IATHQDWCRNFRPTTCPNCSILCLTEKYDEFNPDPDNPYERPEAIAERVYGIPHSVVTLQLQLSCGLPDHLRSQWTPLFFDAIAEGADLSDTIRRFLYWALTDTKGMRQGATRHELNTMDEVAILYRRALSGEAVTA